MRTTLRRALGIVIGLVILIALVIYFRGCGGSNPPKDPPTTTAPGTESEAVKELRKQLAEAKEATVKAEKSATEARETLQTLAEKGAVLGEKQVAEWQKGETEAKKYDAKGRLVQVLTKVEEEKLRKKHSAAEEAKEKELQLQDKVKYLQGKVRSINQTILNYESSFVSLASRDPAQKAWEREKIRSWTEKLRETKEELAKAEADLLNK